MKKIEEIILTHQTSHNKPVRFSLQKPLSQNHLIYLYISPSDADEEYPLSGYYTIRTWKLLRKGLYCVTVKRKDFKEIFTIAENTRISHQDQRRLFLDGDSYKLQFKYEDGECSPLYHWDVVAPEGYEVLDEIFTKIHNIAFYR